MKKRAYIGGVSMGQFRSGIITRRVYTNKPDLPYLQQVLKSAFNLETTAMQKAAVELLGKAVTEARSPPLEVQSHRGWTRDIQMKVFGRWMDWRSGSPWPEQIALYYTPEPFSQRIKDEAWVFLDTYGPSYTGGGLAIVVESQGVVRFDGPCGKFHAEGWAHTLSITLEEVAHIMYGTEHCPFFSQCVLCKGCRDSAIDLNCADCLAQKLQQLCEKKRFDKIRDEMFCTRHQSLILDSVSRS